MSHSTIVFIINKITLVSVEKLKLAFYINYFICRKSISIVGQVVLGEGETQYSNTYILDI